MSYLKVPDKKENYNFLLVRDCTLHVKHCRLCFPLELANLLKRLLTASQIFSDVVYCTVAPLLVFMTLALWCCESSYNSMHYRI